MCARRRTQQLNSALNKAVFKSDEEKSSFVFGGKESGAGAKADAFDAVVRAPASGQSE